MAHHGGGAFDVDVDDAAEVLGAGFPKRGVGIDDGGVVEDEIWGTEFFEDGGAEGSDVGFAGDVAGLEMVRGGELVGEFGDLRGVASAAGDVPTGFDEEGERGAAEATGAAGDDDGFGVHANPLLLLVCGRIKGLVEGREYGAEWQARSS